VAGSALETTVTNLMEMGFEREQVQRALRAAFNNPEVRLRARTRRPRRASGLSSPAVAPLRHACPAAASLRSPCCCALTLRLALFPPLPSARWST
jgi:UV excision repair protein RAD23